MVFSLWSLFLTYGPSYKPVPPSTRNLGDGTEYSFHWSTDASNGEHKDCELHPGLGGLTVVPGA